MSVQEQIAKMIGDADATHKRVIEYVCRQIRGGRHLREILEDPYITNRTSDLGRRALLEEPAVVEAASAEALDGLRAHLDAVLSRA